MQERLRIFFRHKQLYYKNDPAQPVRVVCDNNGIGSYEPGLVPVTEWLNVTGETEYLEDFSLAWNSQTESYGENGGEVSQFGSNYSKGLSGELRFSGSAFEFIYDWLMTDPCQILNAVEVLIVDVECSKQYRTFELKLSNTRYRPKEEPCIVTMPLREADQVWHSFQKTIIEDNWQNWFNKDGTSAKEHPTFAYIVEKKPKFFLSFYVVILYVVGMLSAGLLVGLNAGKRWIRKTLGFTYFCPSPLIRTYIENICQKYGYTYETIFDDLPENPYRDVCLFWPVATSYKNFEDFDSPSTAYIWDNRSVLPFSKFLNQLKKVFNAEWYVTPEKKLVFKHKSHFDGQPPVYDFTNGDELQNLVYTFSGKKLPAYGDFQFRIDPQDTCSNEVKWRYNSIVDFDGPNENPLLEGHLDRGFEFASTAFHKDGSSVDFLQDAIETARLVAVGAIILGLSQLFISTGGLTVFLAAAAVSLGYALTNDYINNFFDSEELNGMVRTSSSEVNVPRLLLWDRNSPMNRAKVVYVEDPVINPYYNEDLQSYYDLHPTYENPGYFGTDVTRIYNYPLFIDEDFTGNLYDRFHEYDNPLKNPVSNQEFEAEVDLCCEWLDRLGVWENDFVKIGGVVILENRNGRQIKGRLTGIDPNYKTGFITLKGQILK